MLWTEKMFGVKKPIIAMLHIDPLPGDPLYKSENDMDKVVEHAREDLHALQDGGVDGIIFSKFALPAKYGYGDSCGNGICNWEFTI